MFYEIVWSAVVRFPQRQRTCVKLERVNTRSQIIYTIQGTAVVQIRDAISDKHLLLPLIDFPMRLSAFSFNPTCTSTVPPPR